MDLLLNTILKKYEIHLMLMMQRSSYASTSDRELGKVRASRWKA